MIDWTKAIIPFEHAEPINDGQVISIDGQGELQWECHKRMSVEGSYSAKIQIQSDHRSFSNEKGVFSHIVLDGNPVKFLQGHNLWGTDDLIGLIAETVYRLSTLLGIFPTPVDWDMITKGHYELKRVDSTMMIALGSRADVKSFLYSAERTAHLRHKGQAVLSGQTLYWGKNSRRESLKMYAKGDEIRAKGHELPEGLRDLPALYKWADDKLRIEAVTRAMELKDRGLQLACNWGDETPTATLNNLLNRLNMSEQHTLSSVDLEGLPGRMVLAYQNWKDGHDIKKLLPKMTFYRYRNELLKHGIDIAIKQGNRQEPSPNVIEFRRVLRPERCEQVPSWAVGTSLYFEPRAKMPEYHELFPKRVA